MMSKEITENYNIINYLKIIDLSLLNLLDYLSFDDFSNSMVDDDRLILNFNGKTKSMLEKCVINNIKNNVYYGKINILVDTCTPRDNWRCIEQIVNKNAFKYALNDTSVYIDLIKMNSFFTNLYKVLLNSNSKIIKEEHSDFTTKTIDLSFAKKLFILDFKSIDIYDSMTILTQILSNFGNLNKDNFNYNLISDGNHAFLHGSVFLDELKNDVRLELISKGII